MQFVCAVYLMAAVNAYDFDIVVRNESGHRFSIVKDFRVPQSSCSDVQYGLNEMHTDAVLASPVKLHLHLSISDYRAAHDDDRLEFVSDTGHFLIKFSKPTSSNPCPYPILFGINSGQQDSKKIKDASYIIECLYSRASGGYVVTIKNHPQQYTPS
jgi:hypothetical protein